MECQRLLFELYGNFYGMEKRRDQSLTYMEFREKLLQQFTTEELTKELTQRKDRLNIYRDHT